MGYGTYGAYKRWLRDDFNYRCAYCLWREQFETGAWRTFPVEHFRPKSRPEFAHLETVYENLYYSCVRCNSAKGSEWPTDAETADGLRFVDPCDDVVSDHLAWNGEQIVGLTSAGDYTVRVLKLDELPSELWRARAQDLNYIRETVRLFEVQLAATDDSDARQQIEALVQQASTILVRYLGPPVDEVPTLATLAPPGGNSRPDGIAQSYAATQAWPPAGMIGPDEFLAQA